MNSRNSHLRDELRAQLAELVDASGRICGWRHHWLIYW